MSIRCPCCKQDVKTDSTIMVDKTGLMSVAGLDIPVRLCPQEVIVINMLIRAMPGSIERDVFLSRLYNEHNEPDWANKVLQVLVSKLRNKLAGSVWGIPSGHYGYGLVRNDVGPVALPVMLLQEVAHGG